MSEYEYFEPTVEGGGPTVHVTWIALEAPQSWPPGKVDVTWLAVEAPQPGTHFLKQAGWRFRNDDGTETTATWKDAENTGFSVVDGNTTASFRLRVLLQEAEGKEVTTGFLEFQQSVNGGAWVDVLNNFSAGSPARFLESANFADSAVTTKQMNGAGTFVAGRMKEIVGSGTAGVTIPAGGHSEYEASLQLDLSQLLPGDSVRFRLTRFDAAAFDQYLYPTVSITGLTGSLINVWSGSAWVPKPLKRWDGSAWVPAVLKRWSGSAWVQE